MLRAPGRRQVLAASLLGVVGLAAGRAARADNTVRAGIFTIELVDGASPPQAKDGWDWEVTIGEDVSLSVRGDLATATPALAAAAVLAPTPEGVLPWAVVGHPPRSLPGATLDLAWDIRSVSSPTRTGVIVAGTVGSRSGVLLLHGPDGWSPSLRRSVLSGIEVSDEP